MEILNQSFIRKILNKRVLRQLGKKVIKCTQRVSYNTYGSTTHKFPCRSGAWLLKAKLPHRVSERWLGSLQRCMLVQSCFP